MVTKLFTFLFLLTVNFAQAQDNLSSLVWATHNTGVPQEFLIDHYTNANLLGVPGQDIDVAPPQANARKVIVAVLDTGVDFTHPQLKNVMAGPGYNVINSKQNVMDTFGHGTHIAGIIAAQLDSRGFQGVSPNLLILPVKIMQTGANEPVTPNDYPAGPGTALTEDVAKGVVWAINNGAEVINLSLSWPTSTHSKTMDDAMALAVQKNVIVVSSAANDSTTANLYPCVYDNVICVGSHNPDGSMSHFSNYGPMVDLLAPGVNIFSTIPVALAPTLFQGGIGYDFKNGTSMSAPFVAGAIADLLSRGFSPNEATARILLGARGVSAEAYVQTPVQGQYTTDHSTEQKTSRFGNLDIKQALALTPSPLILPQKKGFYEVDWDGTSPTATIPMTWINRWVDAQAVNITVQGQSFSFPAMPAGASVVTNVQVNLGASPEDIIHLSASVDTNGYHKAGLDLIVQVIHTFNANSIPANAIVKKINGLDPTQYSDIRSVENVDNNPRADLMFMRETAAGGTELAMVQDNQFLASAQFATLTPDQFLAVYRLPDSTYVAVFTKIDMNIRRPSYYIEKMDANFKFVTEVELGTDVTVLSEGFTWAPFKGGYTPLWVSIGFTPPADMPAYDPWNPTFQDTKIPRLYYLDGNTLHRVALADDEGPLQILLDGRVIISKGSGYLQTYQALTLKDGQIALREDINLPEYRMLIGLAPGIPTLELSGDNSSFLAMPGTSTPGNMRVTAIGKNASFDDTLKRSTYFDALITVSGVYHDPTHQYYLVKTDYNLQFFTSGSDQTLSTTLNRYSLLPSMIAASDFFPTIVRDQNGNGLPAMYVPTNADNGSASEIIVVDPAKNKIMRPALLHLEVTDGSCYEMGDLIQARTGQPAKQVFICNQSIVQIPLQIND